MSVKFTGSLLCIILLSSPAALAQTRPDAGTLLQEQRQPGATLPERLPEEEKEKSKTKPPEAQEGPRVLVKGFRFSGYEGVATEAELQKLVKGTIGKKQSFADLNRLAGSITSYLRAKGLILAWAYLPRQDVTDGIVRIVIVGGRIDKTKIDLKQPSRVKRALLEGIAGRAVAEGAPMQLEQVERAVLLINDLPGIDATATLEPGEVSGTSRVVIQAEEGPLFHGVVVGDNFGDRFTGEYRGTGQVSAYDATGLGDQINLTYTGAERLHNWRASYALPLGSTGLTWNTSYTGLTYKLGKEFSSLDASGRANTIYTGLGYPLLRTRNKSLWASAGFEYLLLEDEAQGVKTSDRDLAVGTVSLNGTFFDTFGGEGLTNFSAALGGGDVNLAGHSENRALDAAGPRTEGGFVRGTYALGRLQRLTRRISLSGSIRGQFASGNLDSSQKFLLGGPTGIRAYPVGEALGDDGHIVTVETRYDVPALPAWAATQLIAFWDGGWVRLHHNRWAGSVTNAEDRNDYTLSGAGVGVNVGKSGLYSLRASYAHKIGPNSGRSLSGKDADNLSDDGRFWLQLIVWL